MTIVGHDSAWEKETTIVSVRGYFIVSSDGRNGHDDAETRVCDNVCVCALCIFFLPNEFTDDAPHRASSIRRRACIMNVHTSFGKMENQTLFSFSFLLFFSHDSCRLLRYFSHNTRPFFFLGCLYPPLSSLADRPTLSDFIRRRRELTLRLLRRTFCSL